MSWTLWPGLILLVVLPRGWWSMSHSNVPTKLSRILLSWLSLIKILCLLALGVKLMPWDAWLWVLLIQLRPIAFILCWSLRSHLLLIRHIGSWLLLSRLSTSKSYWYRLFLSHLCKCAESLRNRYSSLVDVTLSLRIAECLLLLWLSAKKLLIHL